MEGSTEQYGLKWLTWRIATPLITEESVNCLAAQKAQHTNISRGNALTMPWNIRMADFKTGRSYVNLSRNALAQQTEPYSQLSRSKVKIQNYGAALSWAAPNIRSHWPACSLECQSTSTSGCTRYRIQSTQTSGVRKASEVRSPHLANYQMFSSGSQEVSV